MIRPWRTWVLLILLVGPILAYMGFGTLWLWNQGWIIPVGVAWIICGLLFSILLARWTKDQTELLPPLDWDAPQTFSPRDRVAWDLIQHEAEQGETLEMSRLSDFDIYTETGKRIAHALAAHYQPDATDPIGHVAVVELLTALELATEDLNHLCRQVPGGDLITTGHWKKAVQAANFVSRASDIYSVILPLFNPLTGLVRLGTQHMIQKPAWRDMQQNMMRWFYRAFVNRLGVHLIELYSGRLVIGADQYRRLTRRGLLERVSDAPLWDSTVTIGVASQQGIDKSAFVTALQSVRNETSTLLDESTELMNLVRLREAKIIELPAYQVFRNDAGEGYRDRSSRADAVAAAVETDLLVLLISGPPSAADLAFARDWHRWLTEHPSREPVPVLVVELDTHDGENDWKATLEPLQAELAPTLTEVICAKYGAIGVDLVRAMLPPLVSLIPRAERAALIRHLQKVSTRSKAKRLFGQVTKQGARLWKSVARDKAKV